MSTMSPSPLLASSPLVTASPSDFWMPEEALPHKRTFMQWPVNRTVYPDRYFLADLQTAIAKIANTIVEFEPVVMLMDGKYEKAARRKLSKKIEIWDIATDDLWARDSGPVFVRNTKGDLAISQFNFNGWGNKQVHKNDGKIAATVAKHMGLPVHNYGLVGEAGGVEFDGHGTLIAHESSWINPNRNKGTKAQIEQMMFKTLGAKKIIWAPGIMGQDITDYHIDSLARFVGPNKVLIQLPKKMDPRDPWSKAAFETYDILKKARDHNDKKFEIVVIQEPYNTRVTSKDFVASYVNYYICNGAAIMAQFGDKRADQKAKQTLISLFPNREIIALNVDPIGEVGGGIHCTTQQQPLVA